MSCKSTRWLRGFSATDSEVRVSTLDAIEQAIQRLPALELAEFRRWFTQYDESQWDAQIESDVDQGKLDALAAEALADYDSGKAIEL